MTDTFYVTTAIAYPNGAPHIGHAYEMIATDAIARWARLSGKETYFLTGTDEHGIKMVQTAAAEGITARELADRNAARFKELAARLDVSNDDFIRTTEPRHYESSQEIWRRMAANNNGDIYQSTYKGWYSVRDEAYFDEEELTDGEGGKKFAPTGAEVKWVEEDSYFFRLSAYQDRLLQLYTDRPDFIAPEERRNEIVSFVKAGLRDVSISRTTFDWGIPVPGAAGHVMYVWVDALTNYITGVGFPDSASEQFRKFWPANLHVIGKDIIRFHTVYWPAFLMSAGIEVPHRVFAHGFLTSEGKKMSKSVGNIVDPHEQLDLYGTDPVRWYCLREVSFGQDGDWGREKFINRNNSDLANNFGNLAQRSLSMIQKNFGGALPEAQPTEAERAIVATAIENHRQDGSRHADAADPRGRRRADYTAQRRQPLLRRPGAMGPEGRPATHGHDPCDHGRHRPSCRHRGAGLRSGLGSEVPRCPRGTGGPAAAEPCARRVRRPRRNRLAAARTGVQEVRAPEDGIGQC